MRTRKKYSDILAPLRDKRMVIIFDECHRSQFGDGLTAGLLSGPAAFSNSRLAYVSLSHNSSPRSSNENIGPQATSHEWPSGR
jgi:hypothetical protein